MNRGPTPAELDELRRTLKPGQQQRLSEGVYVRLDGKGRLRFQTRLRLAGANSHSPARTFDTWEAADRDYRRRRYEKENLHNFTWRERKWPIERYAVERYWPDKCHHADLTLLEYRTVLERDVLAYFRGWTLEQIVTAGELAAAGYAAWLRDQKTVNGVFHSAAYDKALNIAGRLLNHARKRGIMTHNPISTLPRLHRTGADRVEGGRPIEHHEAKHPRIVERIRIALVARGSLRVLEDRCLVSLLTWLGLRPNEALYLRYRHVLEPDGRLRDRITIEGGVKDVAGHLIAGPTKTGRTRYPLLWTPIAEELVALHQAQGRPALDGLVLPNRLGEYRRSDNWRHRNWSRALHAAGIAAAPTPTAAGAFDPLSLRHTCATVMFHAVKPESVLGH
jgi:integrase